MATYFSNTTLQMELETLINQSIMLLSHTGFMNSLMTFSYFGFNIINF